MNRKFEDIKEQEDKYQLNTYAKLPIAIEHGEGVYVYGSDGRKYLDLYGGHAVALIGHCHPSVVGAVREQVGRLVFYSNVVYSSVRASVSEAIVEAAPEGIDRVYFCNSGAESNETAMKIARKFTGKSRVVAMQAGFHGRTTGALSATALGSYRSQFFPLLEGYDFAEFGSFEDIAAKIGDDTAAVILEPIQSMAGVEMADDDYYRKLRGLCTERGVLLIFDEVQTGFGRTGSWFFGDAIGVVPDIITLAKGIGGGIPVGAVLIRDFVSETIKPGEHGSTFGGGPVASVAVEATIRAIREEGLVENAREVGLHIAKGLAELDCVVRVRGRGLLLGVELRDEAKKLRDYLLERGIITGTSSNGNVLRLLAPIILKKEEADVFIEALGAY